MSSASVLESVGCLGPTGHLRITSFESSLTFGEVEARWKEANLHPPRWGNPLGRGTGREHWEAENLLHRRIREIDDLLLDPNVQSSTKTCLHLLKKRETPYVWEKLPIWRN